MGVKITSNIEADFARFANDKERKLYAALAGAMIGVIHDAEWEAKAVTAASGRIDTAAMFNAINSKVQFAAKKIIGEVGFTEDLQDYYLYQTVTGFTHWLSGQRIGPTGALMIAEQKALKDAQHAIDAAIRSVS